MALTQLHKRLRKEAEEIAQMAQVDFWNNGAQWDLGWPSHIWSLPK